MKTTFSTQVRILLCSNCGAPLEASIAGGQTACRYCSAMNQLAGRDDRFLAGMGQQAPIPEPERIARLRTQDGRPLLPPPSIAQLVPNGQLPAWKVQEALAVWQSTRQELRNSANFEAAERLLFLTMVLSNHFSEQNDTLRQRAMFESALDAFTLPRHRQMMRGYLSRCATREGDLNAAEQWLAPCDPRSDDLQSDSAFRFSRAMIDTARNDFNAVLRILGGQNEEVPIMDAMDPACGVLRANAWEKLGNIGAAIEVLKFQMRTGAQSRQTLQKFIQLNPPLMLCAQSFAQAQGQHAQIAGQAAAAQASGGIHKVFVPIGALMLLGGIVCIVVALIGQLVDLGPATAAVCGSAALPLMLTGGIFFGVGWFMRKAALRAERLRVHGISGTARILSVAPTGVAINNVPQLRFDLQIMLPGQAPYSASTKMLGGMQMMAMMRQGAEVAVRVDPQNPQDVLIETS